MKRFLFLLVVVAGGLAAAAFSVPTNAAVVNGEIITQSQLNADLTTIAQNVDYSCVLRAEILVNTSGQSMLPVILGVGHSTDADHNPTIGAAFAANYLQQEIDQKILLQVAAARHLVPSPEDLQTARTGVANQITEVLGNVNGSQYQCGNGSTPLTGNQVLAELPKSFVGAITKFDASQSLLAESLSGVGTTTSDLQKYFNAHRSQFDNVCFSVAEYTTASAAQGAEAQVTAGSTFASVASQAEQGGPQGCDVLYNLVASVPSTANLQSLALNTSSAPIEIGSSYYLIDFTSRTSSSYATVKTQVQSAVEGLGTNNVNEVVGTAIANAVVSVDPRYGSWTKTGDVANPTTPPVGELLNRSVDTPTAPPVPTTATAPTGQSG